MYQAHSSKHARGLGNKARTHSRLSNYFSHPYQSVNARRNMLYVIGMCAIPNSRVILYVIARSLLLHVIWHYTKLKY